MKLIKNTCIWSTFAIFTLSGFLIGSLAQTPTQPEATMTVAEAQAALAQARVQAKSDFQSVIDCRPLSGPERGKCNHQANEQIVAINRHLADAQKAVTKAQFDGNRKTIDAENSPRRAQAEANRQAAIAANAQSGQPPNAADQVPSPVNSPATVAATEGQVAKSSAQPQTKAQKDLVAAEAAYAQAKMQAENDRKTIVDCSPYTGKEKLNCGVQASNQRSEIDKRLQQAYFRVLDARSVAIMMTPLTPAQQALSDALLAPIKAREAEVKANPLYKCLDVSYGAVSASVSNGYGESHKQYFGTKIITNNCKFPITVDIADIQEAGFLGPDGVSHRLDAGSAIEIPNTASWTNPLRVKVK